MGQYEYATVRFEVIHSFFLLFLKKIRYNKTLISQVGGLAPIVLV